MWDCSKYPSFLFENHMRNGDAKKSIPNLQFCFISTFHSRVPLTTATLLISLGAHLLIDTKLRHPCTHLPLATQSCKTFLD